MGSGIFKLVNVASQVVGVSILLVIIAQIAAQGMDLKPLLIPLILAFVSLLAISVILLLTMSPADRKSYVIDKWDSGFFGKREIDQKFDMIEGERIISPMKTCYMERKAPLSRHYLPRDVIVTNKRILIGTFYPLIVTRKVVFGLWNLWRPDLREVPKHESQWAVNAPFGGNSIIKSMSMGMDRDLGPFLRIDPGYSMPTELCIYHPEAEKVFAALTKSWNQDGR